jgi:cytochrome b561
MSPKPPSSAVTAPTRIDIRVDRYPSTSRILHWIIAGLVFVIWPIGMVIEFVKPDAAPGFYLIHESFGFLVLWLMLLRVGNKLIAPAPPAEGSALERIAAASVHGLLYLFLIVMPVSGFLATNAHGFPFVWFGLVPVWSPIDKAPDIASTLSAIHGWSAWILFALFALHIGAVLFHHTVKRDHTLYRIL